MNTKSYRGLGGLLAGCIALADQLSKQIILNYFHNNNLSKTFPIKKITSYFDLVLMWNKGVSFSMFNNYGNTGRYILIGLACSLSVYLIYWLSKSTNIILTIGLSMVLGGAMGNIIDRIRYGAVIDFLHFHFDKWSWPAFNLADSFICVGVPFIILENYYKPKGKIYETK